MTNPEQLSIRSGFKVVRQALLRLVLLVAVNLVLELRLAACTDISATIQLAYDC